MTFNEMADILVRQTWQVAVVFGVVWVCCTLLRRASAHWRYLLWLLVVAKCLTPPIVNIPVPLLTSGTQVAPQVVASQTVTSTPMNVDAEPPFLAPVPSDIAPGLSVPKHITARTTAQAAPRRMTPGQWLVSTWMLIAGIILASVAVRFCATNRQLKQLRVPADEETRNAVAVLARTLGITNPPEVYLSSAAPQPFVWGLIRGEIYVPPGFTQHGTKEERQAILAHELAHVARCDAAVNLVQIVVQALFFFHPLVWWANRRIRHEREKCCDETVLSDTRTEPELYCHAIVEILASRSGQTCWAPVLAVTGSIKNIEDRIVTVLTPDRKFYRRPSPISVATIVLVAACLLPTAIVPTNRPQSLAAADPPGRDQVAGLQAKNEPKANTQDEKKSDAKATASTWQPGQTLEFRAIDARTRKPLPDVTLELQNMGPGIDFQDVKTQTTDAEGLSLVKLSDLPPKEVRIYPTKPGYVPLRVFWDGEPHAIMPKSITIPMEPGKKFGGTIRNQAGKPIPNVTVTVHYWARGAGKNPHIRANINSEQTTSDADGRWHLNTMPAEVSAQDLRIYVKHQDYLSDYLSRGYLPIPVIQQPPLKELFDQTALMVMADGELLEGHVTRSGRPISGARIYLTDVPWFDKPRTTTEKDGRFKITGVDRTHNLQDPTKPLALIVQAAGHAPELVELPTTFGPLEIGLKPGGTVRGKVVDEAGKPVEEAAITATQWRGRPLSLSVKSGKDGTFTIPDLPDDKIEYMIQKEGYLIAEHVEMPPSRDEYSVTLKSLVRIVGSVVDAESGKPLEKFSFMQGTDYDDGRAPFWHPFEKKTSLTGKYASSIRQENFKYRIRVEAEGYMPGESRLIKPYDPDQGEITLDFQLHKAPKLAGIVEGLDEKPLANVEVFLVRGSMNIQDRKVTYIDGVDRESVKTDSQGRFTFPPEVESFCFIAVHELGLGMVTEKQFAASPKITIQPWEEYKKLLQICPRPARGQLVDFPGEDP
jgi:beta-lactamase regulating signal transducer with metallopeptidase domain/uncharacterized GH25 family protein